MGRRLDLQTLLETFTAQVYFQPPENAQMEYPAITYTRDFAKVSFADDIPYHRTKRWQLIVIDRSPDSELTDLVEELPMCSFNRFYVADKLNHTVYNLFF